MISPFKGGFKGQKVTFLGISRKSEPVPKPDVGLDHNFQLTDERILVKLI